MKKTQGNHGITLIALVVTIVVLLILAGVSINLVIGQNGIITKAQEAKEKYEQAAINEEIESNKLYDELVKYLDENTDTNTEDDVEPIIITVKAVSASNIQAVLLNKKPEDGEMTINYYVKLASDSDENYQLQASGTEDESVNLRSVSGMGQQHKIKIEAVNSAGEIVASRIYDAQPACFLAGMQVLTESGMKNIEDIGLGEKVYSINVETNQRELKEVINLYRGTTDEIYELTVGNEVIQVTPRHQFYVVDKGWIRAYDLQEGDVLDAKDDDTFVITKIEHKFLEERIPVYNLTVDSNHNYLITQYELLVHNVASDTLIPEGAE